MIHKRVSVTVREEFLSLFIHGWRHDDRFGIFAEGRLNRYFLIVAAEGVSLIQARLNLLIMRAKARNPGRARLRKLLDRIRA